MSQTLLEPAIRPLLVNPQRPDSPEPESSTPIRNKAKPGLLKRSSKVALHWIRRSHLYFGLFLFPWALLYGVTAFLFNHPTAFSDQKSITFDRSSYSADSIQLTSETPKSLAAEVISQLNATQMPAVPYHLGPGEIRFTREFAFASFKSDTGGHNLLIDVQNGSGTIREQPAPRSDQPSEKQEQAPFSVGQSNAPSRGGRAADSGQRGRPEGPSQNRPNNGIETNLKAQLEKALPQVCKSVGLSCNELKITSIPELSFPVQVGDQLWLANYNPLTGAVTGRKPNEDTPPELSFRRFLLRLHTAHGYPSSGGVRWIWAVIVDVMAAIMCFWGLSGMLMWWQIKSTRLIGSVLVFLGLLAAGCLGVGMHFAMR